MFNLILAFILGALSILPPIAQVQNKTNITRTRTDSKTDRATLYTEVKELKFGQLERELAVMPASPKRDFFAGIVANREGRIEDSIRLLNKTIPSIRTSRPEWAALGLEALADDYLKSYRYADSSKAYADLLAHFSNQIDKSRLQDTKDDAGIISLLKTVPPQTISWKAPVNLKTERSPIGSIDAELTVNGVNGPWIFDTGADFSVLSASFAKRLGIQPSIGSAQTMSGLTGIENRLHVGVLPEIKVGSATIHNVVVLILDDDNLTIPLPKGKYRINAILGYPVFQALGSITFMKDGAFEAGKTFDSTKPAATLYMDNLSPMLECGVDGRKLMFTFDTGADSSQFSVRYYREFPTQFRALKKSRHGTYGAGGGLESMVYILPKTVLRIADENVTLHNTTVAPVSQNSPMDYAYGNLGRDFVSGFDSFTLDFAHMRFSLGNAVAQP